MVKPQIITPNRTKPFLKEAYEKYSGKNLKFYNLLVRFWECRSPMYNEASLLCSVFPEHTLPTSNNGFMNEFHIRSIEECYEYVDVWRNIEFYTRNWKYCEYYINSEPVYHNELDCYIMNILKDVTFPDIKKINPDAELKIRRGKWVHEKLLYNIVKSLFSNHNTIYHYRSPWLENLELDIYIEDLKVAIEYQGIQHYQPIKHWGGVDGLNQRQQNDTKKKKLCTENGVTLIYFDYTESITTTYVRNKLVSNLKYLNI